MTSTHHDREPSGGASESAERWLDVVQGKVRAMRFGSIQIVVHEGRVTQVECTEKTRFPGGEAIIGTPRPRAVR